MPARVLVYCKKSVAHVTVDELVKELRLADLMTLAEILDLPGGETAAVREMWTHFRIEPAGGRLDGLVEIHWHASQRPIQIRRTTTVDGELDETLENLPASHGPGAAFVRAHLAATREIVELQMGVDGSLHLAATISEVLAFYLAERGDGIVWFYHRDFASPEDRATTLWQTGK